MPKGFVVASLKERRIKMEELLERFKIDKYSNRNFALYDGEDLVCVTAYRKGAEEVRRRMIGYELLLTQAEGTLKPVERG
jgi:hypothetical protein